MYIKVKVTPCSKREHMKQLDDDTFAISVKEPAERHAANNRMLELLSEQLSVRKERLRIITGHRSPNKILFLRPAARDTRNGNE